MKTLITILSLITILGSSTTPQQKPQYTEVKVSIEVGYYKEVRSFIIPTTDIDEAHQKALELSKRTMKVKILSTRPHTY